MNNHPPARRRTLGQRRAEHPVASQPHLHGGHRRFGADGIHLTLRLSRIANPKEIEPMTNKTEANELAPPRDRDVGDQSAVTSRLSRDHRLILASYIASRCGMSDTEADLASTLKDPMRELSMSRFRGSKAEERRVNLAFDLLESSS